MGYKTSGPSDCLHECVKEFSSMYSIITTLVKIKGQQQTKEGVGTILTGQLEVRAGGGW